MVIVNSAAMKKLDSVFFGIYPEEQFLGHVGALFLICWRFFILFSIAFAPFHSPTNKRLSIFPHLPQYLFSAFLCHHPNGYELISRYGFITCLSWLIILCIFSYACSIFFHLWWKGYSFTQFLIRLLDFFCLNDFFFNTARLNKLSPCATFVTCLRNVLLLLSHFSRVRLCVIP